MAESTSHGSGGRVRTSQREASFNGDYLFQWLLGNIAVETCNPFGESTRRARHMSQASTRSANITSAGIVKKELTSSFSSRNRIPNSPPMSPRFPSAGRGCKYVLRNVKPVLVGTFGVAWQKETERWRIPFNKDRVDYSVDVKGRYRSCAPIRSNACSL